MPWLRELFFIGGFEPRGPARDHRLQAEAVAAHPRGPAEETVRIGPRRRWSERLDGWTLDWAQPDGTQVHTRQAVMRWDDIVRQAWPRRGWRAWRDHLNVYLRAGQHGAFGPIWRQARPAFWLAMLPLGLGLSLALLWALLAGAAAQLGLPGPAALVLALPAWLLSWRWLEVRLDADWLLRLYGFTWLQARRQVPGLEERLDALAADLVQAAERGEARELLVVGHSTGSVLAASVVARALQRAPWLGQRGPQLALLTLGHCTPLLGWVRTAQWFRDELALLADHPGLTWLDVSAPADWAAFARVPPWLQPGCARLAQVPPRFHRTLSAARYAQLLKHRHALHQQYLRAPDLPGGYDPVAWMAGPQTLAERHASLHANRAPR